MRIGNVGAAAPEIAETDPRTRLSQEKFFSLRPRPLERWLWQRRVPASAERIFWFHWTQGARSGDWCSQFALHFVAKECEVDVSTVIRGYQKLKRLGLIRRLDPGRDEANPFAQATHITEVLVPNDLLAKLSSLPNRPRLKAQTASRPTVPEPITQAPAAETKLPDPHSHLDLKARRERLKVLSDALSAAERERWHQAVCGSARALQFDPDTHVSEPLQREIQQYLASREPSKATPPIPLKANFSANKFRRMSTFDMARLRREVQRAAGVSGSDEISRQVIWSIESPQGSLGQFAPPHALNIALKKLRQGLWTRPNRMPPNWARPLLDPATPETCSPA